MRILLGHNFYRSLGGEDAVYKVESNLLKKHGHEVIPYERDNREIDFFSVLEKLKTIKDIHFSKISFDSIKEVIQRNKPDLAHFHNIFFLITPSVYKVCKEEGIPVLQSLHNFRLLCANGLLFRNGSVCEKCFNRKFYNGVINKCFQNSYLLSWILSQGLKKQLLSGYIFDNVDMFITSSTFSRNKLISQGFPPEKLCVKPNFIDIKDATESEKEDYAVYVGRLSEEKGLKVLMRAWKNIKDISLKIIGEGPLYKFLSDFINANDMKNVELLGRLKRGDLEDKVKKARLLIFPSICYENFPIVILEAFAFGTPVIASDLGSISEIIENNKNGVLFEANDSVSLSTTVSSVWGNDELLENIAKEGKRSVQDKYSPDNNYSKLIEIYSKLVKSER